MTECLVNDAPVAVDFRPETWGELLAQLDRALGRDRRVVTAVRFDGVDEPSFRGPAQSRRALAPVTRIDIEAVEASRLLAEALAAAGESLPALAEGARATAAAYRAGAADAHQQLTALVAAVHSLVALTTAAANAARAAQGAAAPADAAVALHCRGVESALTALIDRHGAADWGGLADTLDGALATAVLDWRRVLQAIEEAA
ncbi:MAG: hypothetical protein AB7H93_18035 [Vicinamibacterales bacterium]